MTASKIIIHLGRRSPEYLRLYDIDKSGTVDVDCSYCYFRVYFRRKDYTYYNGRLKETCLMREIKVSALHIEWKYIVCTFTAHVLLYDDHKIKIVNEWNIHFVLKHFT